MGVILDTSAVLGWVERRNPATVAVIAGADEVPVIHLATIAELHSGVLRARAAGGGEVLRARERTLRFAQRRLPVVLPDDEDAELFGALSAVVRRRITHNDRWIAASAIRHTHVLVTEDAEFAEALVRSGPIPGVRGPIDSPTVALCPPSTAPPAG